MKKFKVGDIVIYTSNAYVDSRYNPLWNGNLGRIKGAIREVRPWTDFDSRYVVVWENKEANTYNANDLELYNSNLVKIKKINTKLLNKEYQEYDNK